MMLWLVLGLSLAHAAAAFWLVSRSVSDSVARRRASIALAGAYVILQLLHLVFGGVLYLQSAS
jgi:hypothetical protein